MDAQHAVATAHQMDAQAKSLDEKEKSLAYMTDNIQDAITNAAGNKPMSVQPPSAALLNIRDAEVISIFGDLPQSVDHIQEPRCPQLSCREKRGVCKSTIIQFWLCSLANILMQGIFEAGEASCI